MKAYIVFDSRCECENTTYTWCSTASQAKSECYQGEILENVPWIELRAKRAPYLDNMESEPEIKIVYTLLKNGWWYDYGDIRLTEDDVDGMSYMEFREKYKKIEVSE